MVPLFQPCRQSSPSVQSAASSHEYGSIVYTRKRLDRSCRLRLRNESTLIDQAVIISGLDLNRTEPGDYNGSGPDIGARGSAVAAGSDPHAPAWYTGAMQKGRWAVALIPLALAGCALSEAGAPRPESVEPGSAREGERTEVTIRGSDFYLEVRASYLDQERSYLRDTFTARLGEVELQEVAYVDFNTLTAVVPGTLLEGVHDLAVQDPEGREGVLRDAFEVLAREQVGCDPENAAADDATCDGLDDDCDGDTDEDHISTPTGCGVGACAGNTGEIICSDAVTEDTCDPFQGASFDDPTCDNVDDDCDGEADEEYEPTTTNCGVGACAATGELTCVDGALKDSCSAGEPASDDPTCDGIDDDCDEEADEDYVAPATSCGVGPCAGNTGSLVCIDGTPTDTCDPYQGSTADDADCDNIDDDCDGGTDDDYVPVPTGCGVGACAGNTGEIACSDGVTDDTCDPTLGASDSDTDCDNVDDNCDGDTDEGYPSTLTTCGVGACSGNTGEFICLGGVETNTCNPTQGAEEESAPAGNCSDLADNDCDGMTDAADTGCALTENTPPVARFFVDPPVGVAGESFDGHASATKDMEDDIGLLTFLWDWDNDGVTDGEGVDSSHVFSTEGTHAVVLMVEDTGGLRGWAAFDVIVSPVDELLVVTTEIDEADGGATPASPGGSGFSLREAILYANEQPGKQVIHVPSGYVIDVMSALPSPADDAGLELVADGAALDCSGVNADCLNVNSSNNQLYGLEIFNCSGRALSLSGGSNNRFARGYIHDNADGVEVAGSDNILGPDNEIARNGARGVKVMGRGIVEWNRIHGHTEEGISLTGQADGSTILGNVVYANAVGIDASGPCDGVTFIHNTVHANTENGVDLGNGSINTDFRNNILSYNGLSGLYFGGGSFLERDHNDYHLNGSGPCAGCAALGPNSMTDDPLYVNAAGYDLRLRGNSTLIDQGVVLPGVDVNRAEPGDYNGGAPDIGAWEAP